MPFRILIAACLVLMLCPEGTPEEPAAKATLKVETFRGKVVPVSELLKKHRIELDPDAAPVMLVLQTEDGKTYTLLKDAGSRLFFTDARQLHRPMQIQGRIIPGTSFLQIIQVHSVKAGKLHEIYYWCEVCSIRRGSLDKTGICECCGGTMELREIPAGK